MRKTRWTAVLVRGLAVGLAAMVGAVISGCGGGTPSRATADARPPVVRDVPSVLRNTIGSEATIRGDEPILVSGFGLVVGLAGTGSSDVPVAIRAELEQEMARLGVGRDNPFSGGLRNISPAELIDHPDTAVVVVTGVVAPATPEGGTFDVLVEALPGTSTTSLEGGRLYTARLVQGMVSPGMPDRQPVAVASGELFINPFDDPASRTLGPERTTARILAGGEMREPEPLTVILDNPSHARAMAVTAAINTSFPRGRAAEDIAAGRNDEVVSVRVPAAYHDRVDEFIELLRHTRIDPLYPDTWANRFVRELKESPWMAESLSWALRALGEPAIPHLRELYTYPEAAPRLAALEAGAWLGDPLVRPYLETLATEGPPALRPRGVRLMARLGTDPRVERFLRTRLSAESIDVRIAAYEALEERRDPVIERRVIDGGFALHVVPSSRPTLYVTMSDRPRVVVFSNDLEIERPVFASVWDDRLMVNETSEDARTVRVFYRDYRTGETTTEMVRADLGRFVAFLGHEPSPEQPEPGLGLRYSEVVGALAALVEAGAIRAEFLTERDRLQLAIQRSATRTRVAERPELEGEEGEAETFWDTLPSLQGGDAGDGAARELPEEEGERTYVVPLAPPTPEGGEEGERD